MNRDGHMVYANKARRLYLWEDLEAPRGIKPTDIDGVKMAEAAGCFFFFDGKETGVQMLYGQARAYRQLLLWGRSCRAVFVIGVHEDLERDIRVPQDIVAVEWWWAEGGCLRERTADTPGAFEALYARFFADADRLHRLSPGAWLTPPPRSPEELFA